MLKHTHSSYSKGLPSLLVVIGISSVLSISCGKKSFTQFNPTVNDPLTSTEGNSPTSTSPLTNTNESSTENSVSNKSSSVENSSSVSSVMQPIVPPTGIVASKTALVSNSVNFELPTPVSKNISLPFNQEIIQVKLGTKAFIAVQGLITDNSFQTLMQTASVQKLSKNNTEVFVSNELSKAIKNVTGSCGILISGVKIDGSIGYFTGWVSQDAYSNAVNSVQNSTVKTGQSFVVMRNITALKNNNPSSVFIPLNGNKSISFVIEPTIIDKSFIADERINPQDFGISDGRNSRDGFSGLNSMGITEFLTQAAIDLNGKKIDGSSVKVGIADTGITNNHVAFNDATGKKRIVHMKDFTKEGSMYFVPSTKFSARTALDSDKIPDWVSQDKLNNLLFISAEVILSPGAFALPVADEIQKMESVPVLVSDELKAEIFKPDSKVKLGSFTEEQFKGKNDIVDLNQNKTTDDVFLAFFVPGDKKSDHKLFVNFAGTGDFSAVKPIRDFNSSGDLAPVFAERIGFDLAQVTLTTSDNKQVEAIEASIVGFDPGNHGSHVAGIIGAKHLLSNDNAETNARGVAPNAILMSNRACSNTRGCNATEAFIDLAKNGAEIVNMSLGSLNTSNDGYGTQELLINRLAHYTNTLFVLSAGNSGPYQQTIGSPSTARMAFSVAATANRNMLESQLQYNATGRNPSKTLLNEDFVFYFSSRGPTANGGFKPNISAPGTQISTIQFNASPDEPAGLQSYWGTSMAAPATSGALALLLDAVKQYNIIHPTEKIPTDVLTIQRAVLEGARPFDTTISGKDSITGELISKDGQFTWIDEGVGMINLPRTWTILKKLAKNRVVTAFEFKASEELGLNKKAINLEYIPQTSFVNRNNIAFNGTVAQSSDNPEMKFGAGLWLKINSTDDLAIVNIKRNLPPQFKDIPEYATLKNILLTTADVFELETTFYGSHEQWLTPSTRFCFGENCDRSQSDLTLIGEGGNTLKSNQMYVSLNREKINMLAPGDHGALIKGYRKANGIKEPFASFIVPVYITVPHKKMTNQARLEVSSAASSFQVNRHYVEIPEGTKLVKVSLEVAPAEIINGKIIGCSGLQLMVAEGLNNALPAEFKDSSGVSKNCNNVGDFSVGSPIKPVIASYTRSNPTAGIWDVHVFGRPMFALSPYKLIVEYRNVVISKNEITGKPSDLKGNLQFKYTDGTLTGAEINQKNSKYVLQGISATTNHKIQNEEKLIIKDAFDKENRKYETNSPVIIETGGMKTSDIDLVVYECETETEELKTCAEAASSGGATSIEKATFNPNPLKFYRVEVVGYKIDGPDNAYFMKETITSAVEKGTLTFTGNVNEGYSIAYDFDFEKSAILQHPRLQSGFYKAMGLISIVGESGYIIANIPVSIAAK